MLVAGQQQVDEAGAVIEGIDVGMPIFRANRPLSSASANDQLPAHVD